MCGIIGVWGVENPAEYVYLGLHAQQHRGQEHCGVISLDECELHAKHGEGLITQVFQESDLETLVGNAAIGHVKYTTQGNSSLENAQPFYVKDLGMAIAHNGEFANHTTVRNELKQAGALFRTNSDTEIALHKFARSKRSKVADRVFDTFVDLEPAYSIIMLTRDGLIGLRDPAGVRPLEIGILGNGGRDRFVLASESVALDKLSAKHIGGVKPGELVIINDSGMERKQLLEKKENLPCIFEHVYLGHPCSVQFEAGGSNGIMREEFGRRLWEEHPADVEVVVPVPDSGNALARGYSEASGIPIGLGLVRSHYTGRTFIEPTQSKRDVSVTRKFDFDKCVLEGKRVVLVDDSIVRGTTIKRLIKNVRSFGAMEVHVRIGSPPYRHGCYLGIDTPNKKKLIAHELKDIDEIASSIGADSLKYLSQISMLRNSYLGQGSYCTHCFDGEEKIPRG